MFVIGLFLSYFYLLLLFLITVGLFRFDSIQDKVAYQQISVIVAARNEQENIANIIEALAKQDYPLDKYEIIVVDDRSEDLTSKIVKEYITKLQNLQLEGIPVGTKGGKKRALDLGIKRAKYPLLAFTDADCLPGRKWLSEINRHFTEKVDVVVGYSPLLSKQNRHLIRLKNLERISIFAVSAGTLGWNYGATCTGRNFAYRKEVFEKVGGFKGLEEIPSGDDDLMLQRIGRKARKMNFMFNQDSIVPSVDEKDLKGQINLETRRASKWKYYPPAIKIGTAVVLLYYAIMMILLVYSILGWLGWYNFLILLAIKSFAELLLLLSFTLKIKKTEYLLYYPIALIIHVPYFVFFGLKGTFGRYKWR